MVSPRENSRESGSKHPACVACCKAKRRCGRESPSCRRCRVRGALCAYPTPRTLPPLTPSTDESISERSRAVTDRISRHPSSHSPPHCVDRSLLFSDVETPWFLDPPSWEVAHGAIPDDDRITYPTSGLDFFLKNMRLWVDQWVLENHCPFIHLRLYGSDLPGSLQYALGFWQTYRSSVTETSKSVSLQMARNWSQSLVECQGVSDSFETSSVDLVAQLGRTQALLIFELVCLFDGDVRARAHGETLLPILTSWVDILIHTAKADASSSEPLDPDGLLNQPQITRLRSDGTTASAWRAWILSESIRRTWVIAGLVDAAYWIMKSGFSICPGSIAFTARTGVWEASSPSEWQQALEKVSTTKIPVHCQRLDRLLLEAKPSDVDELGQALLAYGRGREAIEDWMAL